jgi:hypothetical protein
VVIWIGRPSRPLSAPFCIQEGNGKRQRKQDKEKKKKKEKQKQEHFVTS